MSQYRPKKSPRQSYLLDSSPPSKEQSLQASGKQVHFENPTLNLQQLQEENALLRSEIDQLNNQYETTFKFKITELSKSVDEWRNRYSELASSNQQVIGELRKQNLELKNESNRYQLVIADQSEKMNALVIENQRIAKELEEWENGFNRLEDEYNDLRTTIDLSKMQEELQQAHTELRQKEEISEGLRKQVQDYQEQLSLCERDHDYTQSVLREREQELEAMKRELDRLKGKIQIEQQKQEIKYDTPKREPVIQVQQAERKEQLLGLEIERMNNLLSLKTRENNDLKNQILKLQKEIQALRLQEYKLQDLNFSLDELITEFQRQKQINEQLIQDGNKIALENTQTLKIAAQEHNQQLAQLHKENEYLRSQLNQNLATQDQHQNFKIAHDKLQLAFKNSENERIHLTQQNQLLLNQLNSNQFQAQQLLAEKQDVYAQIQTYKLEIQKLQQVNKELQQHQNSTIDDYSYEQSSANKQMAKLKKENQQLEQSVEELQAELAKSYEKVSQFEIRFPQLIDEIKRLNKILSKKPTQGTDQNEVSKYKSHISEQQSKIEILQQRLDRQERNISPIKHELWPSNSDSELVTELREMLDQKQKQIDRFLREDNNKSSDQVQRFQDEIRRLNSLLQLRNQEIAEQNSKIQDLDLKLKKNQSSPQRYEQRIAQLNIEVQNLQQQLQLQLQNRPQKPDGFTEERGRILSQEIDRLQRINKENEAELAEIRLKFARSVDAERKLVDSQCLVVLLQNELQRVQFKS